MYLVMEIGCLECGDETSVVGVFEDKEQAEDIFTRLTSQQKGFGERIQMFELPMMNTVGGADYVDKVNK